MHNQVICNWNYSLHTMSLYKCTPVCFQMHAAAHERTYTKTDGMRDADCTIGNVDMLPI